MLPNVEEQPYLKIEVHPGFQKIFAPHTQLQTDKINTVFHNFRPHLKNMHIYGKCGDGGV